MRTIDMQTWPRRQHFELFGSFDHPYFDMCAHVDLTAFYPFVKQRGISFTVALVYVLARAANAVPEFRYRLRGRQVVEHEVVHPAITILAREGDLFGFGTFDYGEDFTAFAAQAAQRIACVQEHPTLEDEPGRDDYLFMTAIPWVSFTSFTHPMHLQSPDTIPRFAWGKFFQDGASLKMPLEVQAHHGLMDGIHMARFYAQVQDYLQDPAAGLRLGA